VESLGVFLKSRRDRVTPAELGLRTYGSSRHVPGLRREELAQLARALRLDDVETGHPHNLARQTALPGLAEHVAFDAPRDPERRPSLPRMFFLDPLTRDLHRNRAELARIHVAYLRLTAGRHPTDARLAGLIGELTIRSDDFAALWATGDVADCTVGAMCLKHPTVGAVSVDYQVWLQSDSPDHRLEIYTPNDPGSADALKILTQFDR
jgi:hypothetical protein